MAMNFWGNETCEYCGGPIVERRVTLHGKARGRHVLIENVPAGVCRKSGTHCYAADGLKAVQESIRGRRNANREIGMPVSSL
jgi:YgiT-type zinc finger domain-containing protein